MDNEKRILYVDDEEYMLDCMAATFEIAELSIATASSGLKALELMGNLASLQVVISDFRMPGMNGVELLSSIAEKYPNTTRILCSAYMEGQEVTLLLADGIIHYFIRKPWDINELLSLVCSSLEHENSNDENSEFIPKFMPFAKHLMA